MQVFVRDNDINSALRVLKKKVDVICFITGHGESVPEGPPHFHYSHVETLRGHETPGAGDLGGDADILAEAGIEADYRGAVEGAHRAAAQIAAGAAPESAQSALYVLPLATRIRALFKMDFAEAQYISELRTGPAGHFSYRRVAWEMYTAMERQHPALARHIRVTDFRQPIDMLQR